MRMMLTGAGAVGECILKMLEKRDPKGEWLSYVLLADFDLKRADEVKSHLEQERKYREGTQYETAQVDARDREALTALMREHRIDFVMDAASPFVSNFILTRPLRREPIMPAWEPGRCRRIIRNSERALRGLTWSP